MKLSTVERKKAFVVVKLLILDIETIRMWIMRTKSMFGLCEDREYVALSLQSRVRYRT